MKGMSSLATEITNELTMRNLTLQRAVERTGEERAKGKRRESWQVGSLSQMTRGRDAPASIIFGIAECSRVQGFFLKCTRNHTQSLQFLNYVSVQLSNQSCSVKMSILCPTSAGFFCNSKCGIARSAARKRKHYQFEKFRNFEKF